MRRIRREFSMIAAAILFALTLEACGGPGSGLAEGSVPVPTVAGIDVNQNRRGDPSTFYSGALNQEALRQTREFDVYPLLWLGEEFEGFYLMKFVRIQDNGGFDVVHLIYGECEPAPRMSEPSCVPPLSISTTAAGWIPAPSTLSAQVERPLILERGVDSLVMSGSPILWTMGVVITVDTNSELQAQAIAQLQTVNHEAMGLPPVGPGESLAGFGD